MLIQGTLNATNLVRMDNGVKIVLSTLGVPHLVDEFVLLGS